MEADRRPHGALQTGFDNRLESHLTPAIHPALFHDGLLGTGAKVMLQHLGPDFPGRTCRSSTGSELSKYFCAFLRASARLGGKVLRPTQKADYGLGGAAVANTLLSTAACKPRFAAVNQKDYPA